MTHSIRNEQILELADVSLTRRIIATLRKDYAEQIHAQPQQELEQVAKEQICLARSYHFDSEYGVATFVATAWHLGIGFDEDIPAVAECLARTDMSEEQKSKWLEGFCILLFDELQKP